MNGPRAKVKGMIVDIPILTRLGMFKALPESRERDKLKRYDVRSLERLTSWRKAIRSEQIDEPSWRWIYVNMPADEAQISLWTVRAASESRTHLNIRRLAKNPAQTIGFLSFTPTRLQIINPNRKALYWKCIESSIRNPG